MWVAGVSGRRPWWLGLVATLALGLAAGCGADTTAIVDAGAVGKDRGPAGGAGGAGAAGGAGGSGAAGGAGGAGGSGAAGGAGGAGAAGGAGGSGGPDDAGPDDGGPDDLGTDEAGAPDPFARGRSLYGDQCAFCHGAQGQGYLADNANALAHPEFLAVATRTFLREAIIAGRPGTVMAALGTAWQGPLNDADVDVIVDYIESWRVGPPADVHGQVYAGVPARAEAFYAAQCQECHGPRGRNGAFPSIANPRFLATASDGHLAYTIRRGRAGTPMPAFGADRLDEQALADLVSLIRSWAEPVEGPVVEEYVPDPQRDVINPGGARPTFNRREDRFIAAADIKAAIDAGQRVMLLDARARADFLLGHITGSISVPFFELPMIIDRLPRDTWIIAYCGCPHAVSGRAFDALREAGFEHIGVLDEGYFFWRDREWGVTVGAPPRE